MGVADGLAETRDGESNEVLTRTLDRDDLGSIRFVTIPKFACLAATFDANF
jgi:hypothetical protein